MCLFIYLFKRLTPDSRAPAKQGEGLCATVTLSGKAEAKKVVAEDVCEHKLRNILFHSLSLSFSLSVSPFSFTICLGLRPCLRRGISR